MKSALLIVLLVSTTTLSAQYTAWKDTTVSKSYLSISGALIATGFLINGDNTRRDIQAWVQEQIPVQDYNLDDFLQHAPIVGVITSDLLLKRSKGERQRHIRHLIVSEGAALGTMFLLKAILNEERPNGGSLSTPSGHSTYAFASAGVLYHSLKEDHPFWAYSGYVVGTFVAASRVVKNRHWLSDVVIGAGLGILSSHLSYHLDVWDSRDNTQKDNTVIKNVSLGLTPLGAGLTVQF